MATVICKGTAMNLTIANVLTPVAQVISIDLDGIESETFEADTLNNLSPFIPYQNTGRTEPGKLSGELFFDNSLSSHSAYFGLISTPTGSSFPVAGSIDFTKLRRRPPSRQWVSGWA